jgi:PAS domain-containing protein
MESSEILQEKLKKTNDGLIDQEEVLYQTSGFLEAVLENSKDMIFRTDSKGALVFFSKGGESVLGYELEDLFGRNVTELADDPKYFESLLLDCIKKRSWLKRKSHFAIKPSAWFIVE